MNVVLIAQRTQMMDQRITELCFDLHWFDLCISHYSIATVPKIIELNDTWYVV